MLIVQQSFFVISGMIEKGVSSVQDSYFRLGQFSDESVLRKLAEDILIKAFLTNKGLDEEVSQRHLRLALQLQAVGNYIDMQIMKGFGT